MQNLREQPSLKGFIAFLETKPTDEAYVFSDRANCAVGQYLQSLGAAPEFLQDEQNEDHCQLYKKLSYETTNGSDRYHDIAWGDHEYGNDKRLTFGRCLERARQIAAKLEQ